MKLKIIAALVTVLVVSTLVLLAQSPVPAKDPMLGTWRVNIEKSKYSPGPAPRMTVSRFEERSDGFTLWTQSGIDATGNPTFNQSLRKYDGKDYPTYSATTLATFLASGVKTTTSQASRVVDANTVEILNKDNGKVMTTVSRTISKDGKTYTQTQKGVDAQGHRVDNLVVFERVQ